MSDLSLEKRIQRLEDINAIKKLKNTYTLYFNDCRFDEIGSLFTEDGIIDLGYMSALPKNMQGRKEINERFATIRNNVSQVKHFLHNHTVEVDGSRATGWAFLEARYGTGGQPYNVAARYDDVYRRVDGEWLFEKMIVKIYFTVHQNEGNWAGEHRHQLVRKPGFEVPLNDALRPNLAI